MSDGPGKVLHMASMNPSWRQARPLSRRVTSAVTGPLFTAILVLASLWLTAVPIVVLSGPRTPDVLQASMRFAVGASTEAAEFQGVLVGVLAAIFIVRVIDRSSENSLVDAGGFWAVFFVHALAALVVDAAVIGSVSVAPGSNQSGRVWELWALAAVALVLAWWVDAGVTLGRAPQRRRTKVELQVTSWALHRRAAFLRQQRNVRCRPRLRVLGIVLSTWFVSTVVGSGLFAASWSPGELRYLVWNLLFFGPLAAWATLAVVLVVQSAPIPGEPRYPYLIAWASAGLLVGLPAAVFIGFSYPSHSVAFRLAVVATASLPFSHAAVRTPSRWTLRSALVAADLRRHRIRRRRLLLDFYALRKDPRRKRRDPSKRKQERRRMRSTVLFGRKGAVPKPPLKPVKKLQQQRPEEGLGSKEWWDEAGRPTMFG